MSSTPPETERLERHPTADGPLPEFVDWILGILIALAGMVAVVGGTAIVALVDRDLVAADFETEPMTVGETQLTEAESLEIAYALITWIGAGFLLIGIAMIALAVWYVIARRRTHRRARAGERVSSYGAHALLGGFVTVVLSFIPLSPILGGAVAGYLERGTSERVLSVGALAGVLPMLPLVAFMVFITGGLLDGFTTVGLGGEAAVVGVVMVFGALLVVAIGAILGMLGGYIGGWYAERRATTDRGQPA